MVTDYSKKQKGDGEHLFLKAITVIVIILIIVLVIANVRLYKKKKDLRLQINSYKEQIKSIEESSKKLKDGIANIDNADYIEKIAREENGMKQPGENVVSFIMPEKKEEPKEDAVAGFSFGNLWNWIKSKFQ